MRTRSHGADCHESNDPGRLTTRVGSRWFGGPWVGPRREDWVSRRAWLRKQSLQ